MKAKEILKRAKELREKTERRRRDPRYRKVMGFLKAKGLIFDEATLPRPNVKIDVKDLLWVAEKIEPRVLEVFPAAFLHFNKTFFNTNAVPPELRVIIDAIRRRHDLNCKYRGIEYKKMKHWANHPMKDQRVKRTSEQKISRTYRLKPEAIDVLERKAKSAQVNATEFLERLILQQ